MESKVRARMRLYRPGGQMACELAKNPTVLIVNDSVFAHGGVLAQHGESSEALDYHCDFTQLLRLHTDLLQRVFTSERHVGS